MLEALRRSMISVVYPSENMAMLFTSEKMFY